MLGYGYVLHGRAPTIVDCPDCTNDFYRTWQFLSFGGLVPIATSETLLHPVAEVALVVLLFLDAAQIDLSALRIRHTWPMRMLLIGLPLSIMFGTVAGLVLFPE